MPTAPAPPGSDRHGTAAGPLRISATAGYGVSIAVLLAGGILAGIDPDLALATRPRAALAVLCLSSAMILTRRTIRIAMGLLVGAAGAIAAGAGLTGEDVLIALGTWTEIAVLLAVVPIVSSVLIRRRYVQVVIAGATRIGSLATQLAVLVSGHIIGSVALLAVVPVLGDFLGLRRQPAAVRKHYAQLILRGFAASVLWSPSTGAMGVIVIATGLRWTQLAPALLVVGGTGLLIGAIWTTVAHRSAPEAVVLSQSALDEPLDAADLDRRRLLELILFLSITFALILVLELQEFASTVIVVATVMLATTVGLLLATEGPHVAARAVREHTTVRMPRSAGEASFLLAAGFLGTVLAVSGISEAAVGRTLTGASVIGLSLQMVLPLLVITVTLLGVPPLVAVALVSGALPLALTGLAPTLYAALLLVGSGASLLVAPLTPTMLMVADYSGTNPARSGVLANRVYAPLFLIAMIVTANLAAALLGAR